MFLLTYDIYMSEEKMKEILPQAQIEMCTGILKLQHIVRII